MIIRRNSKVAVTIASATIAFAGTATAAPPPGDTGGNASAHKTRQASSLRFGATARAGWLPDQELGLEYYGAPMVCEMSGHRFTVGGLAQYRLGSSFDTIAGITGSYESWSMASGGCHYGYNVGVSGMSGLSAQLEPAIRWRPGFAIIGLGPLVGIESVSGRAGTGLSEADAAQRGPYWGLAVELGAAFGTRDELEVAATLLGRQHFDGKGRHSAEIGLMGAYLFD